MPPELSVVAIVAAYNEADIIEQVVADLIGQGVHVYFLDDGSTDDTVAVVEPFVGRGVLAIERSDTGPTDGPRSPFNWTRLLERKAAVAREIQADWFIHHDADEFRESPWRGVSLADAIARVDASGFNAIDFASLDFWPTHDRFQPGDDVRAAFMHYAERERYDRVQVRAWKNTGAPVDLASSGGHDVQFPGRRVFPLRFISRHYPIRGQAHGARKVLLERVGRFRDDERARGWHVQYDAVQDGDSFIRDPSTLTQYDADAVRLALTLRHRGVEALEAELEQSRCLVETQRRDLAARARDVDWLREKLGEARQELDARRAETAALRAALERNAAELADARARGAARQNALDAASDALAHQHRSVDGLTRAVADAERRIDALHRSFSWRITAPARAVLRALRGR
jgi:glycosyl transferase family 2